MLSNAVCVYSVLGTRSRTLTSTRLTASGLPTTCKVWANAPSRRFWKHSDAPASGVAYVLCYSSCGGAVQDTRVRVRPVASACPPRLAHTAVPCFQAKSRLILDEAMSAGQVNRDTFRSRLPHPCPKSSRHGCYCQGVVPT